MKANGSTPGENILSVFIDLENLALGVRGAKKGETFDIKLILDRLVDKGKIVVQKAYADWSRYKSYKVAFHEEGIELIEIPHRSRSGKNSADIRLVVDAMDLCYSKEHIDTFVVVSGDSDFSPLVSKLKENNKHVIGLGMKDSTSPLLVSACDEFIYYGDLEIPTAEPPPVAGDLPKKTREAFDLLIKAIVALQRENKEVLWSSMVKDTMKRKRTSFNESYHGYRSFSELLEHAEDEGLIDLREDEKSGTYVVIGFADQRELRQRR